MEYSEEFVSLRGVIVKTSQGWCFCLRRKAVADRKKRGREEEREEGSEGESEGEREGEREKGRERGKEEVGN